MINPRRPIRLSNADLPRRRRALIFLFASRKKNLDLKNFSGFWIFFFCGISLAGGTLL